MPKGPQGQKRPGDAIGAAVKSMRILTGEEAETTAPDRAASEIGRKGGKKGGKARAAKLTPKQRTAAAKKAARARWQAD